MAEIDQAAFAAAAESVLAEAGGNVVDAIVFEATGSVAAAIPPSDDDEGAKPAATKKKKVLDPSFMGVEVAKRFKIDGGTDIFFGKVDEMLDDDSVNDYHVTYSDGDGEDLTTDEVTKAKKYFERLKKAEEKEKNKKPVTKGERSSSRESKKTSRMVDGPPPPPAKKRKASTKKATATTTKKVASPTKKAPAKVAPVKKVGPKKKKGSKMEPVRKAKVSAKAKAPTKKVKAPAKKAPTKSSSSGRTSSTLVYEGEPEGELDGGEWPAGWTLKKFQRESGATKGSTDRYWFSPEKQLKFRSMVQVKKFMDALKEHDGNEEKAFEAVKTR